MFCKSLQDHSLAAYGFSNSNDELAGTDRFSEPGTEVMTIGVVVGENRQEFKIHKEILQRSTKYFDAALASETGTKGLIFLNDEDPATFQMFRDWLYNALTVINIRVMPQAAEVQRLETDLRSRFDKHNLTLLKLYCLGEKYCIEHLQNRAIDAIQDGSHKYGSVFGPAMSLEIFMKTKDSTSKLRDLCVVANVLHIGRGCDQLRNEIAMVSFTSPYYLSHLLQWVSMNFAMFGKREHEGYDNHNRDEGFSILNRAKLCSCLFHMHANGGAHEGHDKCHPEYIKCGHSH